jgi:hypothetical protein
MRPVELPWGAGQLGSMKRCPARRSAMHKEWPAWYSALVAVSALIALIEIVWFLLRDDRMILLAAFIVAVAVFWATWAPGTDYCC